MKLISIVRKLVLLRCARRKPHSIYSSLDTFFTLSCSNVRIQLSTTTSQCKGIFTRFFTIKNYLQAQGFFPKRIEMLPAKVTVSFDRKVINISLQINKERKIFNRPIEENLHKTITRMLATIEHQAKKRNKKVAKMQGVKSVHDAVPTTIMLLNKHGEEIDGETTGIDVWENACILKINSQEYNVLYNPPSVTLNNLSKTPIAGMTIYPSLKFTHSSAKQSRFKWYRSTEPLEDEEKMDYEGGDWSASGKPNSSSNAASDVVRSHDNATEGDDRWVEVGTDKTYTSSFDDVGYTFKLEVTPGNEKYPVSTPINGIASVSVQSGAVREGPKTYLFDARQTLTQTNSTQENGFRLVCYNILADCYANTELALNSLYPYCPKHALDSEYRMQLIQKEIHGYQGDIICLQEVDRVVFENVLSCGMSIYNYASAYANKLHTKEGEALFYNRSKFKLVSVENKILNESLEGDGASSSIGKLVSHNAALKSRLMSLGTCALLAVLQSVDDPSRYIVVVNTHLYFHPRANNMRLVQIAVILDILKEKLTSLKATLDESSTVSYIVCGDLNSNPRTGLVEFMLSGNLPANHADWYSGGNAEYHGSQISLSHDYRFVSACGFPKYTNYVAGFCELLDYVFVNPDHFQVHQVLETPAHELVTKFTALPSIAAPSDHIAQVVNLSWKQDGVNSSPTSESF